MLRNMGRTDRTNRRDSVQTLLKIAEYEEALQ